MVRKANYKISVPTHLDYSSFPLEDRPEGCSSEYTFRAANTSFFLSSFFPENEAAEEVHSQLTLDSVEEGCQIHVSLSMVWVDTVPNSCPLL